MIGSAVAAALPQLQAEAESLMITPCRISRTGGVTADPGTGADVLVAGARAYTGGCKLQTAETQPRDVESGSGSVTVQQLQVHVPASSGPYKVGDLVEILDRPDSPSAVVLRRFRIDGLHQKTYQTAQRLPVVDLPGQS